MHKLHIFLPVILIFWAVVNSVLIAQISFEKSFNGLIVGRANCVQETTDGGYIIVGTSYPDPGDICIIKTDPFGDTLWTRTFGSDEIQDYGNSIQQTTDGGYIVVGTSYIPDPYHISTQLIKTNLNGDTLWTKVFDNIYGNDVQQTSDGGYVIIGRDWPRVHLIKANSSGNTLWTKTYDVMQGISYYAEGNFIKQTSDNGYIVSGTMEYAQSNSAFLLRINSTGDSLWTGGYLGKGYSVCQTFDNGYILAVGDGISSVASPQTNIVRTNSYGDLLWDKLYSDSLVSICIRSVQQTSDDGFILAGSINGKASLIKTNSIGDTIWTRQYGSDYDASSRNISVQVASDEGYVVAWSSYDPFSSEYTTFLVKTLPDGSVVPVEHTKFTPSLFSLDQNYPNPFNPSTTIRYSIPTSRFVTLKVYDVLGSEVARLVSEEKPSGSYEVEFDARGLSSGVYLYKLQSGSFVETKKMIFQK